jgi:hypothetical protein
MINKYKGNISQNLGSQGLVTYSIREVVMMGFVVLTLLIPALLQMLALVPKHISLPVHKKYITSTPITFPP